MNVIPSELWESILVVAGPLALAPSVGACSREIAARRIQDAMRASWIRYPPLPRCPALDKMYEKLKEEESDPRLSSVPN